MIYGVTGTGFVLKRLDEIKAELEVDYIAEYGPINTDPDSFFGEKIAIEAKQLADIWEMNEAVYKATYPSSANGAPLDEVAELVGIKRLAALPSKVIASATGDQGTVLAAGRKATVIGTTNQFESDASVTIDAAACIGLNFSIATVASSTLYTVTINGTGHDYTSDASATDLEIAAGLVAAITAGAEPVTATDNLDGTFKIDADDITVTLAGSVTANLTIDSVVAPVAMTCTVTGPTAAPTGTLTVIDTPVSGWDSVTNVVDATLGRNTEKDDALRTRRANSLQIGGSATVEAIRAKLQAVDGVTKAYVYENTTGTVDGDGRPAKSIECVVAGGTDADIAAVIWANKPGGIEMHGTESVVVVDSQGDNQTVKFSRATQIFCWLQITKTLYSEETYPSDGDAQIIAKAVEFGATLDLGGDVITQRWVGPTFEVAGIATVLVEVATSATAAGPPGAYSSANLAIAPSEIADFDSARVTVV